MASLHKNQKTIAPQVLFANTTWTRIKGLLGKRALPMTDVMWIKPCNSIHTFFMKFPIDVVFTDRNLIVKKVVRHVAPGKMIFAFSAHSVFEFAAGALDLHSIEEGDQLHVDP
jgi:uncharacterized membrane protein (UPF0127 family)